MIIKSFEIDKKKFDDQDFFLIYGENEGHKKEIIQEYKKFDCGPKRAGIDFASIRSFDEKHRHLLSSKFLEDENISLNNLLLPDLNLGIDDEDFQTILSYEGYQLK